MVLNTIIFDLDGTLAEFRFRIREAKEEVVKMLHSRGIYGVSPSETTQSLLDKSMDGNREGFETIRKALFAIYERYEVEGFRNTKLKEGALHTLGGLKRAGVRLGLVTNSGRAPVTGFVERSGLVPYFTAIVTRDDVTRLKPDGEGIKRALHILNASPSQAAYVGDSYLDIRAARDAEVKAVSITGGVSRTEELQKERPDRMISSLGELLDLIRKSS